MLIDMYFPSVFKIVSIYEKELSAHFNWGHNLYRIHAFQKLHFGHFKSPKATLLMLEKSFYDEEWRISSNGLLIDLRCLSLTPFPIYLFKEMYLVSVHRLSRQKHVVRRTQSSHSVECVRV